MRGVINLTKSTLVETPFLIKSKISLNKKILVFLSYLKISFKLFTSHRINPINSEKFLGFKVETFDYGALHFLFREIFLKNTYYFSSQNKNPVIFDCGANIGFSILYFKWLYPDCIIYAFEPDPQTFKLLEKNVKHNKFKNVFLFNFALSNIESVQNFFIDYRNPGWLTMSLVKDRLPKDKIKVKTVKLSKYIKDQVNFLKMDVEGAENKVFQELGQAGEIKKIKKMYIEFHSGLRETNLDQLKDILKKYQYKIRMDKVLPKDVQGDIGIYAEK